MADKDKSIPKFERPPEKQNELRRERRRENTFERLGTARAICIECGERDPRVLEKHHLEGQAYGDTLVHVCRNCHRKLSDLQKDHPPKITEIPDTLEVIAHFLHGLADLFELLVGKLREFAAQLVDRADPNRGNLEPAQP